MKRDNVSKIFCPSCGERSAVVDTKPGAAANTIKRVRRCNACRLRFYTVEKIVPMEVRYKDV